METRTIKRKGFLKVMLALMATLTALVTGNRLTAQTDRKIAVSSAPSDSSLRLKPDRRAVSRIRKSLG